MRIREALWWKLEGAWWGLQGWGRISSAGAQARPNANVTSKTVITNNLFKNHYNIIISQSLLPRLTWQFFKYFNCFEALRNGNTLTTPASSPSALSASNLPLSQTEIPVRPKTPRYVSRSTNILCFPAAAHAALASTSRNLDWNSVSGPNCLTMYRISYTLWGVVSTGSMKAAAWLSLEFRRSNAENGFFEEYEGEVVA